ncbi:MAG TPA: kelch repeat-containing protein, partial [Tepidisphaeraceae bacterium]|nr:kelch repeat-containing protein [Tepidisphaeraceae bacterium]
WSVNLDNPSGGWTTQTALPFSRNHIAGATLGGKIYLIGGQAGSDDARPASDVLAWDPAQPDHWTAVANLPQPRSHAAAVTLNGRLVVLAGGTTGDTPLSSVISYDPATNTWSPMTSLPVARLAPTAAIADGRLIFVGGYFGNIRAETFVAEVASDS